MGGDQGVFEARRGKNPLALYGAARVNVPCGREESVNGACRLCEKYRCGVAHRDGVKVCGRRLNQTTRDWHTDVAEAPHRRLPSVQQVYESHIG
jgi:hypothetical protein